MANEGEIKVQYAVAGESNVSAKILQPDDTVRDGQSSVALDDTGHANLYSNTGGITIEAGDSIIPYVGQTNIGGGTYKAAENEVWDAILTAAKHNVPTSAGRKLRTLASMVIRNELAQSVAGLPDNQIKFDVDASSFDGAYDPAIVTIVGGTGVGQTRLILEYAGSTRIAALDRDWKVPPDATSEFNIIADAGREHVNEGLAQAGTANTITLNALASGDNDAYRNQIIFIRSGTGQDQTKRVLSSNGTTKVAVVSDPWDVIPDSTSGYVMLPMTCVEVQAISGEELSSFAGINFDTYFNNGSVASGMQIDSEDADRQIVKDTTNGWYIKVLRKGTLNIIDKYRMKDIDGNIIIAEKVTVGQHSWFA